MLVSVIVPVRNESAHVRRTLEGLRDQDFDPAAFEVLVIDGDSDDDTAEQVRALQPEFPNLRLFANPRRLASAARNVGVRHARGRFLVIVDGHCNLPDRRYLANLVKAFVASGADCLGRPQPLRTGDATAFQDAVAAARMSWLGHNPDSDNFADRPRFVPPDNVAVAYRREVFEAVGLFDESFDACEDVEFNTRVRRAGLTCYFTPALRVDYQPRGSLGGLLYQMARYGRGRARLARKHGALTLPSLAPALWLLWLPLTFALGLLAPSLAAAFCLSVLLYAAVILMESARLATRGLGQLHLIAATFVAIHTGFGWGFLRECVGRVLELRMRRRPAEVLKFPSRVAEETRRQAA
jgi:succinoglycan biosynthesis protein ExoA